MYFQIRILSTKIAHLIKSESIWRVVVKNDPINAYKYKYFLKLISDKKENVNEFLYFPCKTFKSCPTDVMKNLISESFEIVKEKKLGNNVDTYNSVLKSYVLNNINFDAVELLQEMLDNKINFNQETFSLLIEHYSNLGEMRSVEYLVKEIKLMKEEITREDKMAIIRGYIIAGKPKKLKTFMIENNVDENDSKVYIAFLLGYSSIGQVDIVINTINKMKQKNLHLLIDIYYQIYLRFALKNAPDSHLEKIYNAMPEMMLNEILELLFYLNRAELFDHSVKLLEKFQHKFEQSIIQPDIINSFNSKNCPIELYKRALTILLQFKYSALSTNLFAYMDYNDSNQFANKLLYKPNRVHVVTSLLNKTINEKAIDDVEKSLQLAKDNLDLLNFNTTLILHYIPSMLKNQLVSDFPELIELYQSFKIEILPATLFYCLMIKDYDQYDSLQKIYNGKNLNFIVKNIPISQEIVYVHKSIDDLKKIIKYVKKTFSKTFFQLFRNDIIISKIIKSSYSKDSNEMNESVHLAKKLRISLLPHQQIYLGKKINIHVEILDFLFK